MNVNCKKVKRWAVLDLAEDVMARRAHWLFLADWILLGSRASISSPVSLIFKKKTIFDYSRVL